MDTIIADLQWRYAVKKFDGDQLLPPSKIETLKQAFNLTATSYGLQPIKLLVIQNKALQESLMPFSMNQRQVAQASHVLVLCIEKKIDSTSITEYFERIRTIRGTSTDILDPFKASLIDSFSKKQQDEIQGWAINQAYLAMGNLLTVCAIERIDACPMEGFLPSEYDRILGLQEKGLASVLVLPVGYRAATDMFADFKKVRKDVDESVLHIQ